MNRESIDKDLSRIISEFPDPAIRAKLNNLKHKTMAITYKEGITEEEFNIQTTRLHEDFTIDLKNGTKSSK